MGNWVLAGLVVALIAIVVFAKFYQRSSKDIAFIRTGLGGEKVVLTGGALAIPIVHQITQVSMSTIRLDVERMRESALITKDHLRVDLSASFYVRVGGTREGVALAGQTLGERTLNPQSVQDLLEGKLVDAIRAAVAEMTLEELHGASRGFVERVRALVADSAMANGLELESVSLSRLDQTAKKYFDPANTFDAQGLIRITRETEESRRTRNDIEKATELKIQDTNLAAEEKSLVMKRESEYARLQADFEIAQRRAEKNAQIARVQAEQRRASATAELEQNEEVAKLQLLSDRAIDAERIRTEQAVREGEINKSRLLELAEMERELVVKVAAEDQQIAILAKQRERASASQLTLRAEAEAAAAEEMVATARETARADRDRDVALIRAQRSAQEKSIATTVSATAEKQAARDLADAKGIIATAEAMAEQVKTAAQAEGRRQLNEAANVLSEEQVALKVRLAAFEALPGIIRESVKPIESIEGIRVIDLAGLGAAGTTALQECGGADRAPGGGGGGGDLLERVVGSALRYRMQAPVVDQLLREAGLVGPEAGLEQIVTGRASAVTTPFPKPGERTLRDVKGG